MTKTPQDDPLAPLRQRIDQLDQRIVELLNERAEVVIEVGKVKRNDGVAPIYVPEREQRVLERVRNANAGPLPDSCLEAIYRELMSGSFALERALRIGCLGPRGTFSHMAATRQFGSSVEYMILDDIAAVFEEVEREHVDLGVVPIENSTGGGITDTLDSFMDTSAKVCAEILIQVHHNLLSNHSPAQIQRIYSRPEVFQQCRKWLGIELREAERIAVASSAKAAEVAANEPGAAAIGSSLAAELYGLNICFANIEDNPTNITRFFVIGHQEPRPSGDDKTAVMFTTAHKPGALAEVLDVFRDHQVNLTHIDKRPSQRVNWEYCFFVDCEGHMADAKVADCIEQVKQHCLHLSVLGSFPRARNVLS